MANRATPAFLFSIIGSAYQIISLNVAGLVERNTTLIYYNFGYEILFFTSFFVIWSASRLLEDWKGRITWPSIILSLGIADLALITMAYYSQTSPLQVPLQIASTMPSLGTILALISGPVLITIGGIFGLLAVRQYSREHGRAVIGHA